MAVRQRKSIANAEKKSSVQSDIADDLYKMAYDQNKIRGSAGSKADAESMEHASKKISILRTIRCCQARTISIESIAL